MGLVGRFSNSRAVLGRKLFLSSLGVAAETLTSSRKPVKHVSPAFIDFLSQTACRDAADTGGCWFLCSGNAISASYEALEHPPALNRPGMR